MKSFWLFRSNLRITEYYHQYKNLELFKNNCHDFYLLQGIWYLENGYFDEVIIWRLQPKKHIDDIIIDINGKKFIQKFVKDFDECLDYPQPDISFFRGGFIEYDHLIRSYPKFFGIKLYLGASKRIYPQYGGFYDKILVEDSRDFSESIRCYPYYKTANPNIFCPFENPTKIYDYVWPCNFTQRSYKGQDWFLENVKNSEFLRDCRILHIGNKPEVGKKICKKMNITNVDFYGYADRHTLNELFNESKFGIVTSNETDGCPRISTEIMMSGIPLLIRKKTRLFNYYKHFGVYSFDDDKLEMTLKLANSKYDILNMYISRNLNERMTLDTICKMNYDIWTE